MSVENLDGNGLADQPSVIYAFDPDDQDDLEIRELVRAGFGQPGPSPGDVIERDGTKSDLTDRLPEIELPGRRGLARNDCGDDIPAFACLGDEGCGRPIYVGRTCGSPTCERDWPAAVKEKVVRTAGKLDGLRRALYARYDGRKEIDFNHVVASLPDILVDSDEPLERVLLILKTLLERNWEIDGFAAVYHPYRIKKEYRKDQYDHGGEPGEGDMTWKDVLDRDDPGQYIKFEPHFHLFFPAIRRAFDYSVAEAVHGQSGWVFHRIEKEDNHKSVKGLDDLVHQLTYCFSHAGVRDTSAGRSEFASRLKGDLHNCYIPDGVEDEVLGMFCDAAPRLLGVGFANMADATCDAEVAATGWDGHDDTPDPADVDEQPDDSHPLEELYEDTEEPDVRGGPPGHSFATDVPPEDAAEDDLWSTGRSGLPSSGDESAVTSAASEADEAEAPSPVEDDREVCGGDLSPIWEADSRLGDAAWCREAEYVSGLREAYSEWRERTGGGEEAVSWFDEDSELIEPG